MKSWRLICECRLDEGSQPRHPATSSQQMIAPLSRFRYGPAVNSQSIFPAYRPRRLRQSPALRRLVAETRLSVEQLVLPLFVCTGQKTRRPIAAMPGVFQLSIDELERRYLLHVLAATDNRTRAAEILGINRKTLYRMAARLGVEL